MNKSYILMFNPNEFSRKDMTNLLDSIKEISNWQSILPAAFAIVTEKTVNDICAVIREKRDENFQFIVINPVSKNGWLAKESWAFINNPKSIWEK